MAIRPGQVYLADIGGSDARPIVIVSTEPHNRGRYVIAVPFTSAQFENRSKQRSCVPFAAGDFGLTKDCVAQADALSLLDISAVRIDIGPIGTLDDNAMRNIVRAIGHVIGSDCEPADD